MTESRDVVVVGAGVAGLVASLVLTRSGRTVTCLEARDRVGGRAVTVEHAGLAIDLGATWFWHNEPLVQSTMDQLGLKSFPQAIAGDGLFEATDGPTQRLDGNPIDAPSQRFTAGAESLPVALAEQLPLGTLRLRHPVRTIRLAQDHVVVETDRQVLTAAHVVVALPPPLAVATITFEPTLPNEVRAAAEATSVWMGDMVKAVAIYNRPFWRDDQLAGSAFSYRGPFREFHDHSGPGDGPGAIFGFAPAGALPGAADQDITAAFVEQLHRLFGAQAGGPEHVVVTNWASERYTSPTQPTPRASPNVYGHPVFQAAVDGRLHWASTETATDFAGHLEGAILAGRQAATAVGRDFAR